MKENEEKIRKNNYRLFNKKNITSKVLYIVPFYIHLPIPSPNYSLAHTNKLCAKVRNKINNKIEIKKT